MKKIVLRLFLLGFCARFPAFAQEEPALLVQPPRPREGQDFTVSFLVPHASPQELRPDGGEGFSAFARLVAGPSVSAFLSADPESGVSRPCTLVRYTFRALRPGRSLLGPLPYGIRNRDFFTAPMILEISRARDSVVPFGLEWRLPAEEVYEGQSVAALLEMSGLEAITVPETVSVSKPAAALFEEAGGLGGISSLSAGGRELYRMTVSSWMLTPSSAGRLSLPSARVTAQGLAVDSVPRTVTVRRLPGEVKLTGAVGRFTVSGRTDAEEILLGESLNLFFRVEGEGNLNYLQAPPVRFDDILITGQETASELAAFEGGYRGWIEWVFRLSPQKAGVFSLEIPAFSWFDPESASVETSAAIRLGAKVRPRQDEQAPAAEKRKILRSWDVESCEPWDLYEKPYLYALLLPAGFFFARAVRKKPAAKGLALVLVCLGLLGAADASARKEGFALVDQGAAAYDSENYAEAEKRFREALAALPRSPGIYFNLGLVRAELGDAAGSIFWLRRAVFRNPSVSFIKERLGEAEKTLTHAAPVPAVHPDAFFALFALFLCAACALPWFVKKRTSLFAGLVVLLAAAGFSAGGIAWQSALRGRDWAVVMGGGASMRKIPLPGASEWIRLAEGTALDIESRSGNFALVSTGSGIRGWIEEDTLWFSTEGEIKNGGS
ncbi:MAG: tetratricopeptide repeat protein [Spirochaetia bacterium]|jgi:tetratricopeptide (TPR) repeat protein|nr:tetratricopeptide repeat protein [Spirochaetia bacterium]